MQNVNKVSSVTGKRRCLSQKCKTPNNVHYSNELCKPCYMAEYYQKKRLAKQINKQEEKNH